jgi:hypothetical protein
MYLKIVTYIPDLKNMVDIKGVLLLTKDGQRISVLTNKECGNRVADRISATDESRRIIMVENPLIGGTDEYDEREMMKMLRTAAILQVDITFDGDKLFTDEVWIEEFAFSNKERQVSISSSVARNYWSCVFPAFKKEQHYEKRHPTECFQEAIQKYHNIDLEQNPGPGDSDDFIRITEATKEDVWDTYDKLKAMERERYFAEKEKAEDGEFDRKLKENATVSSEFMRNIELAF